jgi:hypothetical protein
MVYQGSQSVRKAGMQAIVPQRVFAAESGGEPCGLACTVM